MFHPNVEIQDRVIYSEGQNEIKNMGFILDVPNKFDVFLIETFRVFHRIVEIKME